MGLLNFLSGLFRGHKVDVEYIKARSDMSDTLIFTGQPDYTSVISNGLSDGSGTPINPRIIDEMANEVARNSDAFNRRVGLPPSSAPPRGRGVGVQTQQLPPGTPMQPAAYGQMAPNYAPPAPPQQPYMQQPPPPQQPPQGMPIPINNQPQQPPPMQGLLPEPPSEIVMTDTEFHLFVDLPGIPKEDIDLVLTQNNEVAVTFKREPRVSMMSAEAKQAAPKGAKKGGKRKKEENKWQAQINIPNFLLGTHTVLYRIDRPVDRGDIDCKFELGQLHVTLKYVAPVSGTKIAIG